MSTFVHRDLIAEKLEIARTLGLVTRYVVRPTDPAEEASLSVRVWPNPGASVEAIAGYLTRLLDGLVPGHQIVVTGDGEVPAQRVDSARIGRISAAA
jgi:hypothetical protein